VRPYGGPYGVPKSGIYFMSHENGKTTIELYAPEPKSFAPYFLAGDVASVLDRRPIRPSGTL
jgi:hypothetical protein